MTLDRPASISERVARDMHERLRSRAGAYLDDIDTVNPSPAMRKARRDMFNYVGPVTAKAHRLRYRRRGRGRRG